MRIVRSLFGFWLWMLPAPASAHGLAPIAVDVQEWADHTVDVRWTLVSQGSGLGVAADGTPLELVLPADCTRRAPSDRALDSRWQRTRDPFRCARPLAGRSLRVQGLSLSAQAVVVRYTGPAGAMARHTLFGVDDQFRVPGEGASAASRAGVLGRYVRIGVEHIAGGFDHLAFVACLAAIAGGLRRLWWPVTAFTLAHSLTLALGATGLLRLAAAPVEACIALSVLWMASEAVRSRGAPPRRALALTAFAFGLLHGLGFSGALEEVGLSGTHFVWALLGFNLGVELGQLAVIAGLAAAAWSLARLDAGGRVRAVCERGLVELSGVAAGYWVVVRSLEVAGWG